MNNTTLVTMSCFTTQSLTEFNLSSNNKKNNIKIIKIRFISSLCRLKFFPIVFYTQYGKTVILSRRTILLINKVHGVWIIFTCCTIYCVRSKKLKYLWHKWVNIVSCVGKIMPYYDRC